jgi:hypothetical protein
MTVVTNLRIFAFIRLPVPPASSTKPTSSISGVTNPSSEEVPSNFVLDGVVMEFNENADVGCHRTHANIATTSTDTREMNEYFIVE